MTDELRLGCILVGGLAATMFAGWITGSGMMIGAGLMITGIVGIGASQPARQATQAGLRGAKYQRRHFGLTKRAEDHGLIAPGMSHTAPGDMSIDDFNRATRISGQPIVRQDRGSKLFIDTPDTRGIGVNGDRFDLG